MRSPQCNFADFANDESDSEETESSDADDSNVEENQKGEEADPVKDGTIKGRQRRKWSLSNFIVRKMNVQEENTTDEQSEGKSGWHHANEEEKEGKSKQFLGIFRKKQSSPL